MIHPLPTLLQRMYVYITIYIYIYLLYIYIHIYYMLANLLFVLHAMGLAQNSSELAGFKMVWLQEI